MQWTQGNKQLYDCARIPPDPVVLKQVLPGRFGGAAATSRMWTAQTQRSRCTEDSTTLPASNLAALKLSLMERKLESLGDTFWEICFTDFLFFFWNIYILKFLIIIIFFLLYNIVLVLPYINMHPPRVYTCSRLSYQSLKHTHTRGEKQVEHVPGC